MDKIIKRTEDEGEFNNLMDLVNIVIKENWTDWDERLAIARFLYATVSRRSYDKSKISKENKEGTTIQKAFEISSLCLSMYEKEGIPSREECRKKGGFSE